MIRLFASDMDGTLLNSNNEIQHGFYDVFEKIQEKGIIFAAASGRQYYNLLEPNDQCGEKIAETWNSFYCKYWKRLSRCKKRT